MLRTSLRFFSASSKRLSFARAQIVGNVGSVNIKLAKDGTKFINYSLAVNKVSSLSSENIADWYYINVFNEKQIAIIEKILKPGALILVDAEMKQVVLADENGDNKHTVTNFRQKSFEILKFPRKQLDEMSTSENLDESPVLEKSSV